MVDDAHHYKNGSLGVAPTRIANRGGREARPRLSTVTLERTMTNEKKFWYVTVRRTIEVIEYAEVEVEASSEAEAIKLANTETARPSFNGWDESNRYVLDQNIERAKTLD